MRSKSLFYALGTALLLSCSEPTEPPVSGNLPLPEAPALPSPMDSVPEISGNDVSLAAPAPDTMPLSPASPPVTPQAAAFSSRTDLISFARQYLGTPYVYAKSDPKDGFDCSGFINYVYHHFGFEVPRSSIDFRNFGKEVPLSEAKTGDLLLFTGAEDTDRIGHIGIITRAAGPDCEFIHASSGKEMAVTMSSLAAPHYKKRFVKVVDVISR